MKRMAFILLAVLGLAAATASSAAAGNVGYVYGYALEDDGSRCGNDCLAVIYSPETGITRTGAVSNSAPTCNGHTYNFGYPGAGSGVCVALNDTGTFFGTGTFDVWIRHNCPFGGYYYSETKTFTPAYYGQPIWAGTFHLWKPPGGCFA